MSTPCLHWASVATIVPSTSSTAWSKNGAGCWAQTRLRARLMVSMRSRTSPRRNRGQKSPAVVGSGTEVAGGGGVGDTRRIQGVEISLVVAEPLDVLGPGTAGEEIEGDVQDVIGLVVGLMAFEQVQVAIDIGDQSGPACQKEHGADAAGAQALDPLAQFVMDVVGGDHGAIALGAGSVLDPAQDSPLALAEFVEDIRFHSKVSVVWPSEDMRPPPLLPNRRGFSSFFRQMDLRDLYITLGSGLVHSSTPGS